MKVRNLTPKPIGFGSVILLPDQTAELPSGFGLGHPTTKYYLSRKWLEAVDKDSDKAVDKDPDEDGAGSLGPVSVSAEIKAGAVEQSGQPVISGLDAEIKGQANANISKRPDESKPIDRMNKEELQALSFERGVEFAETDTKQTLIDKIKAAKKGNESG